MLKTCKASESMQKQSKVIKAETHKADQVFSIPWLDSVSECRRRYLENLEQHAAGKKAAAKAALKPMQPDADQRRDALAKATGAAEKGGMRRQSVSGKAQSRAAIREATVEPLRVKCGRKLAPTLAPLLERLKKACKCHMKMAAGLQTDRCS